MRDKSLQREKCTCLGHIARARKTRMRSYLDPILFLLFMVFSSFMVLPSLSLQADENDISLSAYGDDYDYTFDDAYEYLTESDVINRVNIRNPEIKTNYYNASIDFNNLTTQLGYYYGAYSFDGEVNQTGTEISFIDSFGYNRPFPIEVVDEYQGHKSVLQLLDNNSANVIGFNSYAVTGGDLVIEFWLNANTTTVSDYLQLNILSGAFNCYFSYQSVGATYGIKHYNGTQNQLATGLNPDQWYHHKIEIDDATDEFDYYLDGVLIADDYDTYQDNIGDVQYIQFYSSVGCIDQGWWIDAIGLPALTNYTEGYNINPNDITELLDIGMDFEFDYGEEVSVVNSAGHDNVINISNVGTMSNRIIFGSQNDGLLEFWFKITEDQDCWFRLSYGTISRIYIGYDETQNKITWWNTVATQEYGTEVETNAWYHISIEFDCSTDLFNLSMNGLIQGVGINFYAPCDYFDNLQILQLDPQVLYLDAVGLSWSNYNSLDNALPHYTIDTSRYENDRYQFTMNGSNELTLDAQDEFYGWTNNHSWGGISQNSLLAQFDDHPLVTNRAWSSAVGPGVSEEQLFSYDFTSTGTGLLEIKLMSYFLHDYGNDQGWYRMRIKDSDDDYTEIFKLKQEGGGDSDDQLNLTVGGVHSGYYDGNALTDNYFNLTIIKFPNSGACYVSMVSDLEGILYDGLIMGDADADIDQLRFEGKAASSQTIHYVVDNVGIYENGTSLVEENGYLELYVMDDITGNLNVVVNSTSYFQFEAVEPVGSAYAVEADNVTVCLVEGAYSTAQEVSTNATSRLLYKLSQDGNLQLDHEILLDEVVMQESDGTNECNIIGDDAYSGSILQNESYFYVQDSRILGTLNCESASDVMKIVFDIEDKLLTNYTVRIRSLFVTNRYFITRLRVLYTDGSDDNLTVSYEDSFNNVQNRYQKNGFFFQPDYRQLDRFEFYIYANSTDSIGKSCIAGFESLRIDFTPEGIPSVAAERLSDLGLLLTGLIPIIAILMPSFLVYGRLEERKKGSGKKALPIIIILFIIIAFIAGVIKAWMVFISVALIGALLLINERRS